MANNVMLGQLSDIIEMQWRQFKIVLSLWHVTLKYIDMFPLI